MQMIVFVLLAELAVRIRHYQLGQQDEPSG